MKLPETISKELMDADISTLYAHFRLIIQGLPNKEVLYTKVRFGINLAFDIHHVIEERISDYAKDNQIAINNTFFHLKDYYTEIEAREDLMRETIYNNMDEDPWEARG